MIKFRCKCGKVMQVKPELAGRQLKCPACEAIIRIPKPTAKPNVATSEFTTAKPDHSKSSPKKKTTAAASAPPAKKRRKPVPPPDVEELEELEEFEEDDAHGDDFTDDYGAYDDYSAPALPTPRRKKSAKKKSKTENTTAPSKGTDEIPPKVLYSLYGLSGLVVIVIFSLIGRSIMNAGEANAKAMALPETFSKWTHEHGGLSSDTPDGWEFNSGGGTGGVPPWASFENRDQDVKITIRGSVSGTAISDIATAGGTVPGDLGADIPDELDPIAAVHQFQNQKMAADYDEYEESEPRKIDSRFGEGRISDFTASKLFTKTYGVRATLVGNQYQYNVICRCPKNRLDEYKPIFEKIINSIGG